MPEPNVTSAEQLDALLEEGKISREEYETLREAMDATAAEEAARRRHERRRLGKSWNNRQLGGVCAGIAEHFGIAPWRVRLIFALAFLFTGGAAIFVYLAISLALPWNEKERAPATQEGRFPWRFAVTFGTSWIFFLLLCRFILLPPTRLYAGFGGTALPHLTLSALRFGRLFSGTLGGIALAIVIPGFLFGVYLALPPNRRGRRIFEGAVYAGLLLLICLLVAGSVQGVLAIPLLGTR